MSGYPRPKGVPARTLWDLAREVDPASRLMFPAGVGTPADPTVGGVTHASGAVRPGDLFAALPGAHAHGASFSATAAAGGAVAALTDPAGAADVLAAGLPALVVADPRARLGQVAAIVYGHPTADLSVIGITGTAGKTSTVYLLEAGMRAAGLVTGLIGTVETRLAELNLGSVRTTPEASDLQALFAVAREHRVAAIAMEVSSHALALGRVNGTAFEVGGITNLGSDHLDFHGSMAEYFAAKATLFDGRCRHEVLNFDDLALRPLRKAGTITYSAAGDPSADWYATDVRAEGFGQRFVVHGPAVRVETAVGLPGRHNVANALLAIACLVNTGIPAEVAAAGVAACPAVPGRLERVAAPGPVVGVVDYAHKPDAIVAVLGALRAWTTGRIICVVGAGGDRDRGKRPLMGAAAAAGSQIVIVTDDNPRSEDPKDIRTQVLRGVPQDAQAMEIAGRRTAIAEAVRLANPGDVIALLGKGHEQGQETSGRILPFDDRLELASALIERFGGAP